MNNKKKSNSDDIDTVSEGVQNMVGMVFILGRKQSSTVKVMHRAGRRAKHERYLPDSMKDSQLSDPLYKLNRNCACHAGVAVSVLTRQSALVVRQDCLLSRKAHSNWSYY